VRICGALWLRSLPDEVSLLSGSQLHRVEGIVIYFGFLLLLFLLTEEISSTHMSGFRRKILFVLAVYYSTTIIIPVINRGYRYQEFFEHFVIVLLLPLIISGLIIGLRSFSTRMRSVMR